MDRATLQATDPETAAPESCPAAALESHPVTALQSHPATALTGIATFRRTGARTATFFQVKQEGTAKQ